MTTLSDARRRLDGLLFTTSRASQAAVVEVLDRLTGRRDPRDSSRSRNHFSRLLNTQLDAVEVCIGDLASLADQHYDTAIGLLRLHREFVQRVFEAVDTRDATLFLAGAKGLAPVVHLDATRSRRA